MTTYLINYADKAYYESQKINTQSGILIGGLDKHIEYSYKDLDESFIQKNKHILHQPRGAGYWLWKPYIIKKTLESQFIKEDDVVFYSDSGAIFINSVKPLVDICVNKTDGLLAFHMEPLPTNKEVLQTKKDAFVLMGCDTEELQNGWAILASFSLWKKNEFTLKFVNEWLSYAEDERILTDLPNQMGVSEDSRHIAHRHDQSIFSLLVKKHKVKTYTDPGQWGNPFRTEEDGYTQLINHTRDRR